ncbi:MAG: hypothetical protein CVV27_16530, partial [Candidatus Melainabacteria bacterium HGW-Melainabacteria-1]
MSNEGLLRDRLQAHATERPEAIAFSYLPGGEGPSLDLSFAQLDIQARQLAAELQPRHVAQARAILLLPTGLNFVAALMGCVYSNLIAIPVPAEFQDSERLKRRLPRLLAIAQDAQASLVLYDQHTAAYREHLLELAPALGQLQWVRFDQVLAGPVAADSSLRPIVTTDLIFLQYSSGSTGQPKGVMVSHGNLMHNLQQIQQAFGHDPASVGVSWLPAYHDLGLVADIFEPLFTGHREILISPFDFIQQPLCWLQAISRYQATTSGAPNFAYALCTRKAKPQALQGLDLSQWKLAYNCAEPVSAAVMKDFETCFAACGFDPKAWMPFLGMAEATLMVSAGHRSQVPRPLSLSRQALQAGRVAKADKDVNQVLV